MYKSVRIRNFRGLHDLEINDLGRVNLIVGENNVGKTAVLEALRLFQSPGNPRVTIDLARARWHNPLPKTPELLWYGLFGGQVPNEAIRIEAVDSGEQFSSLEITLGRDGAELDVLDEQQLTRSETLQFRFKSSAEADFVDSFVTILGNEVRTDSKEVLGRIGNFLSSDQHITPETISDQLTRAFDTNVMRDTVAALKSIDPRAYGLSVGYNRNEGRPMILIRLDNDEKPMPINLLGGGFLRVMEMILTLFNTAKGVLLIDDVDSGIYTRKLPRVWEALDAASQRATVQLVATTHSWECVVSAVRAFDDNPDDFRLHRLERRKDRLHVVTYEHEIALAAVTGAVEVR